MYDIIGDIHGHAEALERLLGKLGYHRPRPAAAWRHPGRQAFFVGDFIDRGPDNPGVLRTVRAMIAAGSARAVIGNHEYNAILFNAADGAGGYLRPHTPKNVRQHQATLEQFSGRRREYEEYIAWFATLPLYYEEESLRIVHACWHPESVALLRRELADNRLPMPPPADLAGLDTPLALALDVVLKGPEFVLPEGRFFEDKDGHRRYAMRYRWWEDPTLATYGQLSMLPVAEELHNLLYTGELSEHYPVTEKPVFFGHYWLKGTPALFRHNVCCLDYSVAKGGKLVAYRFDGEQELSEDRFVIV